jgi:hypothetical protein
MKRGRNRERGTERPGSRRTRDGLPDK